MRAAATISVFVLVGLCALSAAAQSNRRPPPVPDGAKGGWIHGLVVNDQTGLPLTRAEVILRPVVGTSNSILTETDEHGKFIISQAGPGSYTMVAQRDGYIPCVSARRGPFRMPPVILLQEGTHLRDITFRLRPWAVIAGKIRFDDAEPAVGASVQLYRESIIRGRHSMQPVAGARANDRGEYRVHGLLPGSYYIAASRSRTPSPTIVEQSPVDDLGRRLTEFRYATTFYPSAQKLSNAALVHAESGQEIGGIDIYLKPVPAVSIGGRATNGLTGQPIKQPNIVFRRVAADGLSSIPVPVNVQVTPGDGFLVTGVTAGPYLVTADLVEGKLRIFDRRYLTVTEAPIENVELVLAPQRAISGVVRLDDSPRTQLSKLAVSLEPRTDLNPPSTAPVSYDGSFTAGVLPGEVYDAYIANLPADYYVKSVRLANLDVGADGIAGSAAAPSLPLILTISSRSAKLQGRAFLPDGNIAGGATILVVPDPVRGRVTAFQAGSADEYGVFHLTGIAPGRYTAFAFYDDPPCDIYDENALATCRALGRDVVLAESAQETVDLRVPY